MARRKPRERYQVAQIGQIVAVEWDDVTSYAELRKRLGEKPPVGLSMGECRYNASLIRGHIGELKRLHINESSQAALLRKIGKDGHLAWERGTKGI